MISNIWKMLAMLSVAVSFLIGASYLSSTRHPELECSKDLEDQYRDLLVCEAELESCEGLKESDYDD